MKKYLKAISLIEIILVLVVISSITTMAVRYYMITIRNLHVSQAIKQVKKLTEVSYEWLQTQKQADFSGSPEGTPISNEALINADLIQANTDTTDPWNGNITVAPGTDSSYVMITLNNLPAKACRNMTQQLKTINHAPSDSTCNAGSNNQFNGEF